MRRALGRSAVYEYLSAAFLYPTEPMLQLLRDSGPTVLEILRNLGYDESASHFQQVQSSLLRHDLAVQAAEYVRIFGHTISRECPPYEAEYGQQHIFQTSQVLADIGSFYQAFGLAVAPEARERLDHISVELEFMHALTLKEAHALRLALEPEKIAVCRDAGKAFLDQHLGRWACHFARRLQTRAGQGYYCHLAEFIEAYMRCELQALGITPPPVRDAPPSLLALEEVGCYECPLASGGPGGEVQ
jgi:DMSO reductase family type II enzyme chaperone